MFPNTRNAFAASLATVLATVAGTALADITPIMFTGLEFAPLGNAVAADGGDHLSVSNIGSSGEDGVSIHLGAAEGLRLNFFDPTPPQVGTTVDWIMMVPANAGDPDVPGVLAGLEPGSVGGTGHDILIGGMGASTAKIKIFKCPSDSGVELVGDAEITLKAFAEGPTPVATIAPAAIDEVIFSIKEIDGATVLRAYWRLSELNDVLLPDQLTPVEADLVVVEFDNFDPEYFTEAIVQASNTPGIAFEKASVQIFDTMVMARGKATIEPEPASAGSPPLLTVSNIGSSGEDGVRIDLGRIGGAAGSGLPKENREFNIGMPPAANGDGVVDAADYTVWRDSPTSPSLAEMTSRIRYAEDASGALQFSHGALGDATQTVMFFDGLSLVGQIQLAGADDPSNPTPFATSVDVLDPNVVEGLRWTWWEQDGTELHTDLSLREAIELSPAGLPSTVFADKIIIVTPHAEATKEPHVSWVDIQSMSSPLASESAALTFTSDGVVTPCPTDLNGDGATDGADLATLLANWGGNSPIVDLNADGVVDGADLAALLAGWGVCP